MQHRCTPDSDVVSIDGLRSFVPRTCNLAAGKTLEVELAADLRVGTARVWHVIAVERHHVTEHVRVAVVICRAINNMLMPSL